MIKPNWPMVRSGVRMAWRSAKLGLQALPNTRLVKIRLTQLGISIRVALKGLAGVQSPSAPARPQTSHVRPPW